MTITEIKEYATELREIKDVLGITLNNEEIEELIDNLGTADFTIELGGNEYRFINETKIEGIYEDTIRELIEECYLGGKDLPSFLVIDWMQTAQNCLVDGYGHTFSSHDGSEYNAGEYFIFRTN